MRHFEFLLDDLILPEGPRWRDDRLYLSDLLAREVRWCELQGPRGHVVDVPAQPSGLGWLPDGRMIVASVLDASVLIFDGSALDVVVDLSDQAGCLNDMVVDDAGRAYVGSMPNTSDTKVDVSQLEEGSTLKCREKIFLVDCIGRRGGGAAVRVVADDINFPNGAAIADDGATLIVAESMSNRILIFDIDSDGTLHKKRVWATLPGMPDGICLDADGCIWTAMPFPQDARGIYRVAPGGALLEKIAADWIPLAVMLGGPDRKSLFITEVRSLDFSLRETHERGNGRLRVGDVDVPGIGLP